MEEQIFCDGIGRIAVIGGVVRLDLITYSATETDASGQPRPILSHRIVMGMDGFLRSSEKVLDAAQRITRAAPAQPAPQPAPPQPARRSEDIPQQVPRESVQPQPASVPPVAVPPQRPFP